MLMELATVYSLVLKVVRKAPLEIFFANAKQLLHSVKTLIIKVGDLGHHFLAIRELQIRRENTLIAKFRPKFGLWHSRGP